MSAHQTAAKTQATGEWNEVKGRVRQKWGQLTDDELDQAEGQFEQLIGVIQQKTGESREQIERFVQNAKAEVSRQAEQIGAKISDYSAHASESVREGYAQLASATREQYDRAEAAVRRNPSSALAVAFGVGVAAGLGITLCVRLASRD